MNIPKYSILTRVFHESRRISILRFLQKSYLILGNPEEKDAEMDLECAQEDLDQADMEVDQKASSKEEIYKNSSTRVCQI